MKKRLLSLLMALAMAAALLPLDAALAAEVEEGSAPAEASYEDDAQAQEASEGEPEQKDRFRGRLNGYIPVHKDLYVADPAALHSMEGEDAPGEDELPAAYRSDEQPWAARIRVKDQVYSQLCWAFSMTSAAEYSYAKELYEKTGEIYSGELSPGHIAQFFYNRVMDPLENTEGDFNDLFEGNHFSLCGGDELYGMQHLATWSGVVSESAAPFEAINDHILFGKNDFIWDESNLPYPSTLAYGCNELILEESIFYNALNPTILKQLILQYGACTVGMGFDYNQYMNLEELNPETGECYIYGRSFYNDTGEVSVDHAVTIVGWDKTIRKRISDARSKQKTIKQKT